MNSENLITVLLAEDHTVVREGLRKLLEAEHDIEVVGEAHDGRRAVALARAVHPDVIIMDIAMPGLNGMEATRQIRKTAPASKVLILSAHSGDLYIKNVMSLGASGYLIKQNSMHFLSKAIREIQKGNTYLCPSIASRFRMRTHDAQEYKSPSGLTLARISAREKEVLQLIAEGHANKQIAGDLYISTKTVEKHRDHLMHKLDIHDTAGLTRYAISAGIIKCDASLMMGSNSP